MKILAAIVVAIVLGLAGVCAHEEHEHAAGPGRQWLDEHMDRAERFVYAYYITAVLAEAALVGMKRFPKAAGPLVIATLVSATTLESEIKTQ